MHNTFLSSFTFITYIYIDILYTVLDLFPAIIYFQHNDSGDNDIEINLGWTGT